MTVSPSTPMPVGARSLGEERDEPTVFVIDDDPAVLRSLRALLTVVFPRVECFSSAREFLEACVPERPGCLVLDVAMPEMSGLELQERLRREGIELPIVFITAHGNVQMAVEAMQKGAVDFLEKPFREQELWESVRKALEIDSRERLRKAGQKEIEDRLARLTPGERRVLDLILEGKSNREIAVELTLSVRTVEDRRARLMRKMEAQSIAELVRLATAR
jgi:two-component system, LuxR family, response regulator FixJ